MIFCSGCEAADVLAAAAGHGSARPGRAGVHVRAVNGKGEPNRVQGEQIPLPMRIAHLTQDAEALARLRSPAEAITVIRQRSGHAYDPAW